MGDKGKGNGGRVTRVRVTEGAREGLGRVEGSGEIQGMWERKKKMGEG